MLGTSMQRWTLQCIYPCGEMDGLIRTYCVIYMHLRYGTKHRPLHPEEYDTGVARGRRTGPARDEWEHVHELTERKRETGKKRERQRDENDGPHWSRSEKHRENRDARQCVCFTFKVNPTTRYLVQEEKKKERGRREEQKERECLSSFDPAAHCCESSTVCVCRGNTRPS
ncbi:hypothetical protein TGP89_419720 [Toxoplasma gondii p89]|uniref:Uncharacterized protein n=1 Tax=Toxoplasma gondii p89 TaxID=943119 RepID=A0A086K5L7_TOXGO|nr:hypothetical protein TGP89_419720 [Toxoplasma gondii p89]